jgi:hypothetical protein
LICDAVGFFGRASAGRAKPPMIKAVMPDGTGFEAYLKSPEFHEAKSEFVLEREWLAAKLALALGLPVAIPAQIKVSGQFIESITDGQLRQQLERGPDVLFGSLSAGQGWNVWSSVIAVPRTAVQTAASIYLFDTVIQNWDRCVDNPNLLQKGDQLLMIDHEEAFVSATGAPPEQEYHRPPWVMGAIVNHSGTFEEHPLWSKLRPATAVDFRAACNASKALPDDAFSLYSSEMPLCWSHAAGEKIVTYLSECLARLDNIVEQVENNYTK